MARPIAPTPRLDAKASKKFLKRIEKNRKEKTDYIATPKLEQAIQIILADNKDG